MGTADVILGLGECPVCHKLHEIYWPASGMPRMTPHTVPYYPDQKCLGSREIAVCPIDSSTGKRITKPRGAR